MANLYFTCIGIYIVKLGVYIEYCVCIFVCLLLNFVLLVYVTGIVHKDLVNVPVLYCMFYVFLYVYCIIV